MIVFMLVDTTKGTKAKDRSHHLQPYKNYKIAPRMPKAPNGVTQLTIEYDSRSGMFTLVGNKDRKRATTQF